MKIHTLFFVVFLIVTISGCSTRENPDGRVDVIGTLTINGQPFGTGGGIFLEPIDGAKGDGGGCTLYSDGKFHITGRDAPKPGKYTVRIYGVRYWDTKNNRIRNGNTEEKDVVEQKVVPNEFNVNSKIVWEIVKGKRNVFDYDIQTDYEPQTIKGIIPRE